MTNRLLGELPTTIFEVMSVLAKEHNAVNLGQGFPDDPGPLDIRQAAADAAVAAIDDESDDGDDDSELGKKKGSPPVAVKTLPDVPPGSR